MSLAAQETSAELPIGGLPLGPGSLTWELFADKRMALLGPRAAVLQNMLPALGQGVEDHSVWFAETLARLQRSIPPIFTTVYGADPVDSGHQVRDFHKDIKGKLPDGRPYSALNPDTYYWAHATFVEHMVVAADTFIRPLSAAEKDQIIAESVTWFARYGVSARRSRAPGRSSRPTGPTRSPIGSCATRPRPTASVTPRRAGPGPVRCHVPSGGSYAGR